MKHIVSFIVLAALAGLPARAELPHAEAAQLIDEANAAFNEANATAPTDATTAAALYDKAILRYERVLNEGGVRNGKLYYNLGNAYYLKGDLGRAVLNYRRAMQYRPSDPNLQQNLAYARDRRADTFEAPPAARLWFILAFWDNTTSVRLRMGTLAAIWIAAWVCASIALYKRRAGFAAAGVLCLLVSGLLFVSVQSDITKSRQRNDAVVLADEITVRQGNGEAYDPALSAPIHTGVECRILETRGPWHRIELPNGEEGWIPDNALERV